MEGPQGVPSLPGRETQVGGGGSSSSSPLAAAPTSAGPPPAAAEAAGPHRALAMQDDAGPSSLSEPLLPRGTNQTVHREAVRKDSGFGLLLMGLSAVFFSTMTFLVKLGSKLGLPSFQMVFARSLVQLVLALAACFYANVEPLGPKRSMHWMALRGAFGAVGLAAYFFAISVMDLGDATTIFFTGPMFTMLFAFIFLREPITCIAGFASLLSLSGVALVSRPAFLFGHTGLVPPRTSLELVGSASSMAGAVMSAGAYVIVRKFSTKVHFLVSVVWFGIVSSVLSPIAAFALQKPVVPDASQWCILIGIGAMAFLGQCFLNSGLQAAAAGPGTVMRNLDVVFAYMYQVLLLGDPAQLTSIAGACLVTSSAVVLGVASWCCKPGTRQ